MDRSTLRMFLGWASMTPVARMLTRREGPNPPRLGAKWRRNHNGPGTAKSYFDRPGSGLLTKEEITRRRGGNPKGAY